MTVNKIEKTEIRKGKLIVNGRAEIKSIYKVSIESLFYNDENGRISTFMAEYNALNPSAISTLSRDLYNDIINDFIINSETKDSFNRTKNSIKEIGQMETGVILEDGRVIDGNRRFTCLRQLYKETGSEKFRYFECFVLPVPSSLEDRMSIKSLELSAQFGTDNKVAYSPIDRLADIYRDLVGPQKLFTAQEYSARLNGTLKIREIQKMMIKAETLWEYLEFIREKGRWDIARDRKLDGPIEELANLRKSINEDEWAEIAHVFFLDLKQIASEGGDRTRITRRKIKLYKEDPYKFKEISNKSFEILLKEENTHKIDSKEEKNKVAVEIKKAYQDVRNEYEKATNIVENKRAREKQLKNLNDIYIKMNEIDLSELKLSSSEIKHNAITVLNKIENRIQMIKNGINNA
jgi:hypothetical protein